MLPSNEPVALPQLIPLHQVPDLIPSSRRGKRLALATLYRWAIRKKLATIKIGGSRYVTRDALVALTRGESTAGLRGPTATERAQQAGEQLEQLIKGGRRQRHPRTHANTVHSGAPFELRRSSQPSEHVPCV
jgi:hypothetical protein